MIFARARACRVLDGNNIGSIPDNSLWGLFALQTLCGNAPPRARLLVDRMFACASELLTMARSPGIVVCTRTQKHHRQQHYVDICACICGAFGIDVPVGGCAQRAVTTACVYTDRR